MLRLILERERKEKEKEEKKKLLTKTRKKAMKKTMTLKMVREELEKKKGCQICPICLIEVLGWKMLRHIERNHPHATQAQKINYQPVRGGKGVDKRKHVTCPVCHKILYGKLGVHLRRKVHSDLTDDQRNFFEKQSKKERVSIQPISQQVPDTAKATSSSKSDTFTEERSAPLIMEASLPQAEFCEDIDVECLDIEVSEQPSFESPHNLRGETTDSCARTEGCYSRKCSLGKKEVDKVMEWVTSFDGKNKSGDQMHNVRSVIKKLLDRVSLEELASLENTKIVKERYIEPMLNAKENQKLSARTIRTYICVLKSELFPYLKVNYPMETKPQNFASITKLEWQLTRWHNNLSKEATMENIGKRVSDMGKLHKKKFLAFIFFSLKDLNIFPLTFLVD